MTTRLEKLEEEKEAIEAEKNNKSGDIEKITKALEAKHAKEIGKLTDQLTAKDSELSTNKKLLDTHVVGEGLTAALVKAKVKPEFMAAAKARTGSNRSAPSPAGPTLLWLRPAALLRTCSSATSSLRT